jgi:hypothetical protein
MVRQNIMVVGTCGEKAVHLIVNRKQRGRGYGLV